MHAYCLFCETQRCERIAQYIERVHGVHCISPRIIHRIWIKGRCVEESHRWLPGYIFLYSPEPITPFFWVDGVIRWLGNSELTDQDLLFAETLYQQGGVMGTARLVQVGDRCRLSDPLWENMQGTIIKLDRNRKRCCLEFEFAKVKRTVWVGYDLIKTEKQ